MSMYTLLRNAAKSLGNVTVYKTHKDLPTKITNAILSQARPEVSKRFTPSSIIRECPLQRAHRIREQRWDVFEPFDESMRRHGIAGDALHEAYQNTVLPQLGLFGQWECNQCRTQTFGFRPESKCSCNKRAEYEYTEFAIKFNPSRSGNPNYELSGKIDGIIVDKTSNTWYIVELKTVLADVFDGVYRRKSKTVPDGYEIVPTKTNSLPLPNQVEQAQIYAGLALLALDPTLGDKVSSEPKMRVPAEKFGGILVVNINRNTVTEQVHHISYNASKFTNYIESILRVEQAVLGTAPLETMLPKKCKDSSSPHAKHCPWKNDCFTPRITKSAKKGR